MCSASAEAFVCEVSRIRHMSIELVLQNVVELTVNVYWQYIALAIFRLTFKKVRVWNFWSVTGHFE